MNSSESKFNGIIIMNWTENELNDSLSWPHSEFNGDSLNLWRVNLMVIA